MKIKIRRITQFAAILLIVFSVGITAYAEEQPSIDSDAVWENIKNLQSADEQIQKDIETIRNEISQLQSQYQDIQSLLNDYTDTYNNLLLKQDMTNELLIYLTDFLESTEEINIERYNETVSQNRIDTQNIIDSITQSAQGTTTQVSELVKIASVPDVTRAELSEELTKQLLALSDNLKTTNDALVVVNKLSGYVVAGIIILMVIAVGVILYSLFHNTIIKRMF